MQTSKSTNHQKLVGAVSQVSSTLQAFQLSIQSRHGASLSDLFTVSKEVIGGVNFLGLQEIMLDDVCSDSKVFLDMILRCKPSLEELRLDDILLQSKDDDWQREDDPWSAIIRELRQFPNLRFAYLRQLAVAKTDDEFAVSFLVPDTFAPPDMSNKDQRYEGIHCNGRPTLLQCPDLNIKEGLEIKAID